jgi:hypothetical protein
VNDKWNIAGDYNATQTRNVERAWRDTSDLLKKAINDLPPESIRYCDEIRWNI